MNKNLPEIKLPLYYNPMYNGFHVIHEETEDTVTLGGCCTFLSDAHTSIMRYVVPKSYLINLFLIDYDHLDEYDLIELYNLYSDIFVYRIPKELKDKTYLFYQNKAIIISYTCERNEDDQHYFTIDEY